MDYMKSTYSVVLRVAWARERQREFSRSLTSKIATAIHLEQITERLERKLADIPKAELRAYKRLLGKKAPTLQDAIAFAVKGE
jgi:hypothetical protein